MRMASSLPDHFCRTDIFNAASTPSLVTSITTPRRNSCMLLRLAWPRPNLPVDQRSLMLSLGMEMMGRSASLSAKHLPRLNGSLMTSSRASRRVDLSQLLFICRNKKTSGEIKVRPFMFGSGPLLIMLVLASKSIPPQSRIAMNEQWMLRTQPQRRLALAFICNDLGRYTHGTARTASGHINVLNQGNSQSVKRKQHYIDKFPAKK